MLEPHDLWQPWVGHCFPGITPRLMCELTVHQFVAMYEFAEAIGKA